MTSTTFPLTTIGVSWQSDPDSSSTVGCLSKFRTSEDPYPTPLFSRCIEVTVPLTIGWKDPLKVSVPIEDIPTFPDKVIVISE